MCRKGEISNREGGGGGREEGGGGEVGRGRQRGDKEGRYLIFKITFSLLALLKRNV